MRTSWHIRTRRGTNPAGEKNTLYRLAGGIVARVSRPGQADVARKETHVSRWLNQSGIPTVQLIAHIAQPVEIEQQSVTFFWRELPPHRATDLAQTAKVLRRIHALHPPNDFALPDLAPFVRLEQRITEAVVFFDSTQRRWLLSHLNSLVEQYEDRPPGLLPSPVHGDAGGGNIVATFAQPTPIVLDLERFAYGPPEWDLTSIAVSCFTFGSIATAEWRRFSSGYGHDVTEWAGYPLLRSIRELRKKVTFAAQVASQRQDLATEAQYRLACIQGEAGPRPWHWKPVP